MLPDEAVNKVAAALSPLPEGYFVEGDDNTGNVLVYSKHPEPEGLGFVITKLALEDGLSVETMQDIFADLVKAVEAAQREAMNGSEVSGVQ